MGASCECCIDEAQANREKMYGHTPSRTPWSRAIASRDITRVKKLIRSDCRLMDTAINRVGHTAVHYAVINQDDELLEVLCSAGADLDIEDTHDENTPLHLAVARMYAHGVRILVNNGANINCKNKRGIRPIDMSSNSKIKHFLFSAEKLSESSQTWFGKQVGVELEDVIEFWSEHPKRDRRQMWDAFIGKQTRFINDRKDLYKMIFAVVYATKKAKDASSCQPPKLPLKPVVNRLEKILSKGRVDYDGHPIWECTENKFISQLDVYLDVIAREIREGDLQQNQAWDHSPTPSRSGTDMSVTPGRGDHHHSHHHYNGSVSRSHSGHRSNKW